jgi:hypothetical protein
MEERFTDDSRHFNKSTRLRADDAKTLFAELPFVGMVFEESPDPASTREFEDREQLLPRPAGNARIGVAPIQKDGLLQAVEVCRAIGAALQMVPDLPVGRFAELKIKLFLSVPRDIAAFSSMSMNPMHINGRK